MEKIIEKIDNYNLFTNIVPGFLILMFNVYYYNLHELNIGEQIVIAYFAGQTLNRIGSITIGILLLKLTREKGEPYNKYIVACRKDDKIDILLQERDTFRTFCTLVLVCMLEIIFYKLIKFFNISNGITIFSVLTIMFVIYAISFCKYNKYISERIRIANKKKNDQEK